jgi:cysteinyl-tRNA synthetase
VKEAQTGLSELTGILGLTLRERQGDHAAGPFIDLLVSLRAELRQQKLWEMADKVRDSLAELGVALEDGPQGTVWKHRG